MIEVFGDGLWIGRAGWVGDCNWGTVVLKIEECASGCSEFELVDVVLVEYSEGGIECEGQAVGALKSLQRVESRYMEAKL